MKLRTLTIQNFRAVQDLTIRFDDAFGQIRPVTVLAGPNGCGKTSVLYAIVNALGGAMGYRTSDVPEPTDLDIHRIGSYGGLSPTPVEVSVRLDIEFDAAEAKAIPQVWEETLELHKDHEPKIIPSGKVSAEWRYPPGYFPDGTRRPTYYLELTPRDALAWFHGRRNAIRGWRERKLSDRSLLDEIGGIQLFPQDRNLRSRVVGASNGSTSPQDRNDLVDDLQFDEDERRRSPERSVWEILKYLSFYSRGSRLRQEPLPDEQNWEKRIQEQFNRVCAPKKYLGFMYADDPNGAPYFQDGNSVYPLNMAASGEQVIIEYIARMTHPSPMNRSLVLIDEPEVHLHPGWVRHLYLALPKIGYENQFILTTHSLELRAMAAEDNALIDMGEMGK